MILLLEYHIIIVVSNHSRSYYTMVEETMFFIFVRLGGAMVDEALLCPLPSCALRCTCIERCGLLSINYCHQLV